MKEPRRTLLRLTAAVMLMSGCHHQTSLEYVFPNGFRGPALIRENQAHGVECNEARFWSSHCERLFPTSGELGVRSASPGTHWHVPSARYVDGTLIPVAANGSEKFSPNTVALWTFGSVQKGEDWLFVGLALNSRSSRRKSRNADLGTKASSKAKPSTTSDEFLQLAEKALSGDVVFQFQTTPLLLGSQHEGSAAEGA